MTDKHDKFEFFLKQHLYIRLGDGTEHPIRELDERKPDEARLIKKYGRSRNIKSFGVMEWTSVFCRLAASSGEIRLEQQSFDGSLRSVNQ
jgi:hypothetical protein